MPRISIVRDYPKDPGFRPVQVFFDDRLIDAVEAKQALEFEVEPGAHVLRVYNTLVSKSVELNLEEGQTVQFRTGNSASGCALAIFGYLGIPAMGIVLERLE